MNEYIVVCNTIRDANLLANRFVDWQTKISCPPSHTFYRMGTFIVEFGKANRFRFVPQRKMYEASIGFYGKFLSGYRLDKFLDLMENHEVPKCKEIDEAINESVCKLENDELTRYASFVCCPMCDEETCVGRDNCVEIKNFIEKGKRER